ncbi:cytochrome P450 monooxygenase-like protein [Plenodomus tracheiphilus IPT5]|uniref:Cytochrome P450 monooxygenase-like protein n=1 Tax=Plenodomus tracheiphilus IPT5 TaxID=1408161 RepID=A0A6A7BCC9_9PLEO|nr:cytochrome P450 monooxygenase-like protein [Plenodomus tracheiphilus IPT5]
MYSPVSIPPPGSWLSTASAQLASVQVPLWVTSSIICGLIVYISANLSNKTPLPYINTPKWFIPEVVEQINFVKNGMKTLGKGRRYFKNKPYRMITHMGEVTVLPPSFATIIRNEEILDLRTLLAKDFHSHLPGFEPVGAVAKYLHRIVHRYLNKHLNTVTAHIPAEATFAIDLLFKNPSDWTEVCIREKAVDLVTRLSSRVFLGEELCRNEEWLQTAIDYTNHSGGAAIKLNLLPSFLRLPFSWFSDDCKHVRNDLQKAREIINPVVENRRQQKLRAQAEGKPPVTFTDVIEWAEQERGDEPYDAAIAQLGFAAAAVHTTTDLLVQTLLHLSNDPQLITPLREEIVRVLSTEGWKRNALFNMKLLDSAIKEAQRWKPINMLAMRRIALEDITIPGGLTIRKGERIGVDAYNMLDPKIHNEPEKYDMYRFLRMRDNPDNAIRAQLVSTSPEHLEFGHGHYACPGRFLAADEIKIALCHLLLKYDWKLAPGTNLEYIRAAFFQNVNPANKLLYKRRKEEINLEMVKLD